MSRDTSFQSQPIALVLIHGTWSSATHARWLQDDHDFVKLLRRTFGDGVIVQRPEWRGLFVTKRNNSHRHREYGGSIVAAAVRDLVHEKPDIRVFLITHSHGGNVALYAVRELQQKGLHDAIAGVCCMTTPFITAPERRGARALTFFGALGAVALGLCVLAATVVVPFVALGLLSTGLAFPLAIVPLLLVTLPIFVRLFEALDQLEGVPTSFYDEISAIASQLASEARARYEATRPEEIPIFIATSKGDEALAGLASLVGLTGLADTTWRLSYYCVLTLLVFICLVLWPGAPEPAIAWTIALVLAMAIAHVLLAPLLSRMRGLGLGWHSFGVDLVANVSVECLPPGVEAHAQATGSLDCDTVVKTYSTDLTLRDIVRGHLRHWLIYEQEDARLDMVSWMTRVSRPTSELQIERRRRLGIKAFSLMLSDRVRNGDDAWCMSVVEHASALNAAPSFEPRPDWLRRCVEIARALVQELADKRGSLESRISAFRQGIQFAKNSAPRLVRVRHPVPDYYEEPQSVRDARVQSEILELKSRMEESLAQLRELDSAQPRAATCLDALSQSAGQAV